MKQLLEIVTSRRLEDEPFHQLRLNLLDLQKPLPLMPLVSMQQRVSGRVLPLLPQWTEQATCPQVSSVLSKSSQSLR